MQDREKIYGTAPIPPDILTEKAISNPIATCDPAFTLSTMGILTLIIPKIRPAMSIIVNANGSLHMAGVGSPASRHPTAPIASK